jgi:hypothetical protein
MSVYAHLAQHATVAIWRETVHTSSRPCAGTHTPCRLVLGLEQMLSASTDAGGYGSRRKAGTTKTSPQSDAILTRSEFFNSPLRTGRPAGPQKQLKAGFDFAIEGALVVAGNPEHREQRTLAADQT